MSPGAHKKRLDVPILQTSSLLSVGQFESGLALADSEYFRTTARADALGRRLAILHCDTSSIFYFLLSTAFYAVGLHLCNLLLFLALRLHHPCVKVNSVVRLGQEKRLSRGGQSHRGSL